MIVNGYCYFKDGYVYFNSLNKPDKKENEDEKGPAKKVIKQKKGKENGSHN